MIHDTIKLGTLELAISLSAEAAAASCGEFVVDALAADAITPELAYRAARLAAHYARRIPRWPAFGEDWR